MTLTHLLVNLVSKSAGLLLDSGDVSLELGANAEGGNNMGRPRSNLPVREAARWGHIGVVQLLLEHGANWEVAMAEAVKCGRTEVVRALAKLGTPSEEALSISAERRRLGITTLLLDTGVGAMSGSRSPLVAAIGLEHTTMFELLLQRGVGFTPDTVRACLERARKEELDSMLVLLAKHGIDLH